MSPFRLCFIGRADSVHTRRWVDPFVARGDEVWVLNAAARPARRPWPGVGLVDMPAAFNVPWLRYPVWTLHARRILRQIRPDLLHGHCLDLSGWVSAATGYHPMVVTVWGSDIMLHPDRSRLARRLAGWVLARADAVTAPARPLYARAASFAGSAERVHLIHWGVDCEVFRPEGETTALRAALELPLGAPVVCCPRALAPNYNIETVLQAFSHVLQARPDAYLLLIEFNAKPDYRQKIDGWIRTWGLGDRVRFLPRIDGQAGMAALYRLATVIITLPLSDSLSLTVLESMACSTPAVVSDLPAYEDWIVAGETGFRVPTRDAAAAAEAVLWLLDREGECQAFGRRGRRMVQQQASLAQQRRQSIALYEALVPKKPSPQR